ncbi:MAG TPA: hypothetical protein VFX98_08165, partial [Longimicrobiaceae bacterium]|nr:hypothetical protein [Longimicrobiaceae bacterium]
PWVGRAEKADVAALAGRVVAAAAEGDEVALGIVRREAGELAAHVTALAGRLAPWPREEVPVVYHGGVLTTSPFFAGLVSAELERAPFPLRVRPAVADAVAGALSYALRLAGERAAA